MEDMKTVYPEKLISGYYRVKKNWEDEEQAGQFRILAKAKETADKNPGTFVFSNEGEIVYPQEDVKGTVEDADAETAETLTDKVSAEPTETEFITADKTVVGEEQTAKEEPVAADVLDEDKDAPTVPIAYARLKTLMNIRKSPSLSGEKVTVYKKGTICEVYEVTDDNWLKIACPEAEDGFAYVSNEGGAYAHIGKSLYTVRRRDTLYSIADDKIGAGIRLAEIKAVNGLTSNTIRVGQVLLIP